MKTGGEVLIALMVSLVTLNDCCYIATLVTSFTFNLQLYLLKFNGGAVYA